MEDPGQKPAVANDAVTLDLGAFQIKTLKLHLRPAD
jgi:hypothetical protein